MQVAPFRSTVNFRGGGALVQELPEHGFFHTPRHLHRTPRERARESGRERESQCTRVSECVREGGRRLSRSFLEMASSAPRATCTVRLDRQLTTYRGTSLIRNSAPLGPYSSDMPRAP